MVAFNEGTRVFMEEFVFEGGYLLDDLGPPADAFLRAF